MSTTRRRRGSGRTSTSSHSNAVPFHVALRQHRDQSLMLARNFAARVPMTVHDLAAVEEGRVAATGLVWDAAVSIWSSLRSYPRPADPQQRSYPVNPAGIAALDEIEPLRAACSKLRCGDLNRKVMADIARIFKSGDWSQETLEKYLGLA